MLPNWSKEAETLRTFSPPSMCQRLYVMCHMPHVTCSDAINVLEITEPSKFKELQKIYRTIRFKTEPITEQQKNAMIKTRKKIVI